MPEGNPAPFESSIPADAQPVVVLLVDDQAIIADIVRQKLHDQPDLELFHCADPSAAVEFAERIRPSVILLDLKLPGMSGLALLQEYRANSVTRDIPVVILSIEHEPAVKSEAFRLGANDYLVKLPDAAELAARIRHHARTYFEQLQRDEAYRALRASQQQLMEMTAELQRLSHLDPLTGLGNRRYLDEYLAQEWKRGAREQAPLSLLMVDVDDFKRYNDGYGHVAGDEALRQVAACIRRSFDRPADMAARFGGEEFAVVLPNTASAGAGYIAERVRRNIEALRIPHRASSVGSWVTVSIGVATVTPVPAGRLATLLETADLALYEAKRTGRNRVAVS